MYKAIKGIYDHGKITFTEEPPVKSRAEVMIAFLTETEQEGQKGHPKVLLGLLEGKIKLSGDFNDSLDDLQEYM